MTLRLYPSYGTNMHVHSALTIAAQGIRTFQRSTNTGRINYDSPDLMLMIMAAADIYSYIVWLTRIAYIIPTTNQLDWAAPELLLAANYCDAQNLMTHRRQLWDGIQTLITKMSKICVPGKDIMPIFSRRAFIFQNIYVEGTSVKDQKYMYVPAAFYKFTLDDKGAGQLVLAGEDTFVPGANLTVDQLVNFGLDLIDGFFSDDTHATMSGDLFKAYGSNIIQLNDFDETGVITPIFSIEVLEQMKNAIAVGKCIGGTVNQDNTSAYTPFLTTAYYLFEGHGPTASYNAAQVHSDAFLNMDKIISTTTQDVSPELTVVNTRLTATLDQRYTIPPNQGINTSDQTVVSVACGVELCEGFYTWNYVNDQPKWFRHISIHVTDAITNKATLEVLWEQNARIAAFKFHPHVYEVVTSLNSASNLYSALCGESWDYDNYAVMDYLTLIKLHDVCLMSLLGLDSGSVGM